MHELGVLCEIVKKVGAVAEQNNIKAIRHITLEVGDESTYVPIFFEKLFPIAIEQIEVLKGAELKILNVPGRRLIIRDIGY